MKKKINLIDLRDFPQFKNSGEHFRVEKIEQSYEFVAGSYIAEKQVHDLLNYGDWTIIIRMAKDKDFPRR